MKTEALWEQVRGRGLDHLILRVTDGIEADGVAVGILGNEAYRIQYRIVCDARWKVLNFSARSLIDNTSITLSRRGEDWTEAHERPVEALRGCSDVDIMVTPFTNTLPIRRLALEPHQSEQISVVYVRAPDLVVTRADQLYTCLARTDEGATYRYHSLTSGFTADLKCDADGLVMDYPDVFKLIWKKTSG